MKITIATQDEGAYPHTLEYVLKNPGIYEAFGNFHRFVSLPVNNPIYPVLLGCYSLGEYWWEVDLDWAKFATFRRIAGTITMESTTT